MTGFLGNMKWPIKFNNVMETLQTKKRFSKTLHIKTVCTKLPLSLLTQEPWIKTDLCHDLYYSARRHLQENLCHLVIKMRMLSMSSTKLYNIHATPTQAITQGLKNFSNYGYMYQSSNSHGLLPSPACPLFGGFTVHHGHQMWFQWPLNETFLLGQPNMDWFFRISAHFLWDLLP